MRSTLPGLILVTLFLVFVLSWGVNLHKLTRCDFESPYKCEVIHGLGLIPLLSPVFVWTDTDN